MALKALVFGILILLMWGRSYVVGDCFMRGDERQHIQLGSAAGVVVVQFVHDGQPTKLGAEWRREATLEPRVLLDDFGMKNTFWNQLGFGFNQHRFTSPQPGLMVNIM